MKNSSKFRLCPILYYKLKELDWCLFIFVLAACSMITYYRNAGEGLPASYSYLELFLMGMGTNINLVFLHSVIFVIIISKIICFGEMDTQFIIRQKNRRRLFVQNVSGILSVAFMWIVGNLVVSVIQSLGGAGFNVAGLHFPNYVEGVLNINSAEAAYRYFGKFLLNLTLYFICIGLLYYVVLLIIKSKFISIFFVLLNLIINYIFYLCRLEQFYKILFVSKVSLDFPEKESWIWNMGYWMAFLGILLLLGSYLMKKEDMIWRRKAE